MALSTPQLLGALGILYIAYNIGHKLYLNAQIRKLGARAPTRTTYLPFGVDMAYQAVQSALKDQIYEMWIAMFRKWGGPTCYTMEVGVGERLLMTADPENIKAILATQFKDYGKGEQFRQDWFQFLGNGMWTGCGVVHKACRVEKH